MKKINWVCKSNLFNLTLLVQFHLLLCLSDNHFGDCEMKKCGNLKISYPFHIINQQKSYCGYPGFGVSCNDHDGFPRFHMSGDEYVIKNISYENMNFQVINSALFDGRADCYSSLHNLSLELPEIRFSTNHDDIFVFSNCSKKVVEGNKEKRVKCGGIAVYRNDSEVKYLEKECNGGVVAVPYYNESESQSSGRVIEVLEKGLLLNWSAYNCTACWQTNGQCGFDEVNNQFNCYCPDITHPLHCSQPPFYKKPSTWLTLGIGIGGVLFLLIAFIVIWHSKKLKFAIRRQRTNNFSLIWSKRTMLNQNVEAFLKSYGSLAPKRYTYAKIRKMTNNFKEKLGEGGFGAVYKGKLPDGRFVAVKKLKKLKGDGDDFINEVVSMGRTNHVNVVTLLGFCFEGNKRALLFEFLSNGSLDKYIHGADSGQSLPSETLFSVAVGIAKGLDYLHRGCNTRILHFDIKPHNILLDEELCPKISDFGLARLCPSKDSLISMSEARGTIGYIAPEVFCRNFGGISHKSDVYSFGMMLLDMACGRHNVVTEAQRSSEMYFPEWIYRQLELREEIEADGIFNDETKLIQRKMILVGLWCIQSYPSTRPPMNRVLEMLEGPVTSLQVPPRSHLSSTPESLIDISETPLFGN